MSRLKTFGAFCYDFFVGDDWRLALGVVIGVGILVLADHLGHRHLWWLLPAIVVVTLIESLRRAGRSS
jgi:hypothetical protein